jgi:hypothetical protein
MNNAIKALASDASNWEVFHGDDGDASEILIGSDRFGDICSIYDASLATVDMPRHEALALAQLIKAAPSMLLALQALVESNSPENIAAARNVIAAATTQIIELDWV